VFFYFILLIIKPGVYITHEEEEEI
jgi:hypothetical protein